MNYYDLLLKFIYAIFIGAFGTVLLVVFFGGLMSINTVGKLLPFIIGFNAALTGYNLISRAKDSLKYKRTWCVISGTIMVAGVVLILDVLFFYLTGSYMIYMTDVLLLILIGAVLSWLGSILAIKSMDLTISK